MFSAFLNTLFKKAEKITKQYKNCFIIFAATVFLESGGDDIVTAVIAAAHSAPPFSYVVDATLRWKNARTQQCVTEKRTKF